MKTYVKNILLYLVALLGLIAFIAMFSTSLESFDSIKGTWNVSNIRPYVGETYNGETIYKGASLPVVGYIIPLLLAILIIIESFKASWGPKLKTINTVFGILFFLSAIFVLLTKELFLQVNNLGETNLLRNGSGPIFSAICSSIAGTILIVVTFVPSKSQLQFIEK